MIRSSFALTPSLQFFSQILRAAPVLYFKKGHNMERVRESKKQILTFCMYPFCVDVLSAVYICSLRFSLAPFLKGSYVERLAKNKNTLTIFGLPASNLLLTFYPVLVFYWSQSLPSLNRF